MNVAKASVSFGIKPQISVGGQKKDFAEIEVNGKKFQGVDLGNGNYAKLKSRLGGKFDVVLFRGDGNNIAKMSVKVEGGSINRLQSKDKQDVMPKDNQAIGRGSLKLGEGIGLDEVSISSLPEERAEPKIDLTKIKNKDVRAAAEKIAARKDKFQAGIDQAGSQGLKHLAGLKVEAELQKLFELADANNDPQMLKDFQDATSFKGRLTIFQPTSADGRAAVRAAQLFTAIQGDGTHGTVQKNIRNLTNNNKAMREMALEANLLAGLDKTQYVDSAKLLRTADGSQAKQIKDMHREWYLEQATLMKAYKELNGKDLPMQKKLALAMLQSFAKAAPVGAERSEKLALQSSPIENNPAFYHRSASTNPLLETLRNVICSDINKQFAGDVSPGNPELNAGTFQMVDNPRFREVLARDYGMEGVNTTITSLDDFDKSVQQLFSNAAKGEFPKDKVVLDVTDIYKGQNLSPLAQKNKMISDLEGRFLAAAEKFLNENPNVDQKKFAEVLMKNLQVASMSQHKGVDLLLTPTFLGRPPNPEKDSPLATTLLNKARENEEAYYDGAIGDVSPHIVFMNKLSSTMMHTGYRLDPIQARQAWIEVAGPEAVLQKYGIQITELATSEKPVPTVFPSFKDFTEHSSFKKFEALSSGKNAPPYLQILPKATASLLHGLAAYKPDAGGIDKAMKDKGLHEVLQTSYFRMLNAMGDAVKNQGDMPAFNNSIEVIQQEIATMVTLLEPYGSNDFGDAIRGRMTDVNGPNGKPVIPTGLDKPGVSMKPSAMHCLASILSSVESLTGRKDLNVAVVKDHYYESAGAVATSSTYSTSTVDGDSLRGPNNTTQPLDPGALGGKKPLDLYVCDFHHNISTDREHYQLENLTHHVDEMFREERDQNGIVTRPRIAADKFTVAIDCTIDFVSSPDVQKFLEHNKARIESGQLNVVLFRSAQKFDMMGMDNYYGGFTVSINKHTAFKDFNTRMDVPEDQLKGPSMQGLSHNAVHGGKFIDEYRSTLMGVTKSFYDKLPKDIVWSQGTKSPMFVAKTDDPNAVFLDIKFPGNEAATKAFISRMKGFADEEGLSLTSRASFGFSTTNLNLIHENARITPGLESPEQHDRYVAFLKAVHTCAIDAEKEADKLKLTGATRTDFIAKRIELMPSPPKPLKV